MPIDINELRQALGAVQPEEVEELLDRLEAAESTRRDDYQNWMTALDRNAELLAKLEAAEKERDDVAQQLVQSEIGKREISEAHDAVTGRLSVLADENTALQAKIERMERQKPVAEWVDGAFDQYPHLRWRDTYRAIVGAKLYAKFYALPGAKGEEK